VHACQWRAGCRAGRSTGNYVVSVWSPLVINLCRVFLKFGRAPVGRAGAPQNVICRPRHRTHNVYTCVSVYYVYTCVSVYYVHACECIRVLYGCLCVYNIIYIINIRREEAHMPRRPAPTTIASPRRSHVPIISAVLRIKNNNNNNNNKRKP